MKSKGTAYLLLFFLGGFDAHCFYLGKVGKGILYLFTLGLFGIGWLYDLFHLADKLIPITHCIGVVTITSTAMSRMLLSICHHRHRPPLQLRMKTSRWTY